jgi:hypothetical protein
MVQAQTLDHGFVDRNVASRPFSHGIPSLSRHLSIWACFCFCLVTQQMPGAGTACHHGLPSRPALCLIRRITGGSTHSVGWITFSVQFRAVPLHACGEAKRSDLLAQCCPGPELQGTSSSYPCPAYVMHVVMALWHVFVCMLSRSGTLHIRTTQAWQMLGMPARCHGALLHRTLLHTTLLHSHP